MPRAISRVAAVEDPGKIGELEAAVADGAGDAEAGGEYVSLLDLAVLVSSPERNLLTTSSRRGEFVGGELLVADGVELAVDEVVESEVNFCAANVTSENHLVELQSTGLV